MTESQEKARVRVPVSFDVVNFNEEKVTNISQSGLKLVLQNTKLIQTSLILTCQIFQAHTASVLIEPVWTNKDNAAGFRILDCSETWTKMIESTVHKESLTKKAA